MSEVKPSLTSFRLKNFKAVWDSGELHFTPLTVFIGHNGSGKSSLIEGLETFQMIVESGLDKAIGRWHGYENILNRFHREQRSESKAQSPSTMMEFEISRQNDFFKMSLDRSPSSDEVYIHAEELMLNRKPVLSRRHNKDEKEGIGQDLAINVFPLNDGESILSSSQIPSEQILDFKRWVSDWQFLTMSPLTLGEPRPQTQSRGILKLNSDGSNLAEFLLDIRERDEDAFEGIIESLQNILPYAKDLQATLTSELERRVALQMNEGQAKIPEWLLSTGTQRFLALLALLRHPSSPQLIVIEEIENSLDPRAQHSIVEEIKYVIEEGISQVIFTTHSPYLLDFLSLQHIVLAERIDEQPIFYRPANEATSEIWSKEFGPGKLYIMDKLRKASMRS